MSEAYFDKLRDWDKQPNLWKIQLKELKEKGRTMCRCTDNITVESSYRCFYCQETMCYDCAKEHFDLKHNDNSITPLYEIDDEVWFYCGYDNRIDFVKITTITLNKNETQYTGDKIGADDYVKESNILGHVKSMTYEQAEERLNGK